MPLCGNVIKGKWLSYSFLISWVMFFVFGLDVHKLLAIETFDSSAYQLRTKETIFSLYASGGEKDVLLSAANLNTININGITFQSISESRFESKLNFGYINAKLIFNPGDAFYYWLRIKAGQSDFRIPVVGGVDNILSGGNSYGIGFGIKKQVLPGTIVTPAIAVEAGTDFATSRYSSFKSGGIIWPSDIRLNNIEFQGGVFLSYRRYNKKSGRPCVLEPTVGLRVSRVYSTLIDYFTFERVEGVKDSVGMTGALKVHLNRRFYGTASNETGGESFIIEAQFGEEKILSCGLSLTLF